MAALQADPGQPRGPSSQRTMRGASATVAVAVAVAVLSGCVDSGGRPVTTSRPNSPGTSGTITVGGTAANPLRVEVTPGALSVDGSVSGSASSVPPPTYPGFVAAGDVQEVRVTGTLSRPVTVAFTSDTAHAAAVPVIWRADEKVGWYPIAVGDPGGIASAARTQFSPHLPGWVDVTSWTQSAANGITRWARTRTTPPTCPAAPVWADLTPPPLDVLLGCVGIGATAASQAELKLKNNRGVVQELTVPFGAAYADVEGQPEAVRALVRDLAGSADIVLLPPGKELRLGFARPATASSHLTVTPDASIRALADELVVQIAGIADEEGSEALLPALLNLAGCAGFKSEIQSGVLPSSLGDAKDLVVASLRCLAEAVAAPAAAATVAQQLVAAQANTTVTVVSADKAFGPRVDKLAGMLRLAGKIANVVKSVEIARLAGAVFESDAEQLGRASTDNDPATVRLALGPVSPVLPAGLPCSGSTLTQAIQTHQADGGSYPVTHFACEGVWALAAGINPTVGPFVTLLQPKAGRWVSQAPDDGVCFAAYNDCLGGFPTRSRPSQAFLLGLVAKAGLHVTPLGGVTQAGS